jgi:hypothetical protein
MTLGDQILVDEGTVEILIHNRRGVREFHNSVFTDLAHALRIIHFPANNQWTRLLLELSQVLDTLAHLSRILREGFIQ